MTVVKRLEAFVADPIEEPIRSEIFGVERLEAHAVSLAAAQGISAGHVRGLALLPRVRDNGRVLRETYHDIAVAIRSDRSIVPAAQWLVDNFHVIDEQLREIRDDLPEGYYRILPKLATGPLAGLPRVYGLAWAFVAHTDSRFDPETLRRFVAAYQSVTPLSMGELWAVAISLRIVLVENLRRLAESIVRGRAARDEADRVADALLAAPRHRTGPLPVLAPLESSRLRTAFAVQLVQRLRDQDPELTPALEWLDRRLASQGTTPDEAVRVELQRQAAMNVTVRNIIVSMGLISALDWTEFFESVSLVDDVLRTASGYGAMDFATRDAYRHAVEESARASGRSEIDVARAVIERAAASAESDPRRADPGFHLIGAGRRAFGASIGARASIVRRLLDAYLDGGAFGYLGTLVLLTAAILALPIRAAYLSGLAPALLVAFGILALIPASDLAIALLNRSVAVVVKPKLLPRLELRNGVPSSLRTLVVVPVLLVERAAIDELIERIEVHYLANAEGDVFFALLSDWVDAPAETMPTDAELLAVARDGIARLNRRHGEAAGGGSRFLLLHRRRRWNAGEGVWMGWERKRGKLRELNRLLRGATDTGFLGSDDEAPKVPGGVRFVVTLDADTRLPRGAVAKLVGTLAHPLNRPRFDPQLGRVVEGYGILQPRVAAPLPGRRASILQFLTSGQAGIDPYASAVSDVYQDLFGEGSFTGKGIYDVDAFESALATRVPDNTLLSHDLFEGVFARAGLVTDAELFEQAPSHYAAAASRQHRWARGDWQLLPWILKAGLPPLGRWKMIDNLRRTLSAPASLLTLVLGWTIAGASAAVWTAFIVATIAAPALIPVVDQLKPRRRGISKRSHVRAVGRDLAQAVAHTFFALTMMAYQACLMLDAVGRTLWRVYATHRRRLEWTTAAEAATGLGTDLRGFLRRMAGAVLIAVGGAVLAAIVAPRSLLSALPILSLWALSPAIARWISLPRSTTSTRPLGPADARTLRLIARRTWRYFTTFVGPLDHALPPDNFQEDPSPVVAHRTSPTNLGLYLLSILSARDFGWIGTRETLDRLEAALRTMATLERIRGHFFNWYDTTDLKPLNPRYVSSVDSGNLAGHLITLAAACREPVERCALTPAIRAGLEDVVLLVRESVPKRGKGTSPSAAEARLTRALAFFETELVVPADGEDWVNRVAVLAMAARAVAAEARLLSEEIAATSNRSAAAELLHWGEALPASVESHASDVALAGTSAESAARRFADVGAIADGLARGMDFGFLIDPARKLFSIGYRVLDGALDPGSYDLLASEARLTSFVMIAKGDVPVQHWFRLGRALTPMEKDSVLVSWSGSMFEYLMPCLVMRTPAGSLLDQTCRLVVRRQMSYGRELGLPWGISESAYNVRDAEMTYQYSSFGIPGLGLKRGLGDDIVVAPYATALAAMFDPVAAVRNFRRIADLGGRGAYGFYEALDFTPSRLPESTDVAVVRAYMAHHQGMTLIALGNALHGGIMRARFHSEPFVRATDLLLEERTPRDVAVARPPTEDLLNAGEARILAAPMVRRFTSPHGAVPRTHLLSNGRYAVMITAAGSGYSRWCELGLTRWREDVTRDTGGVAVYLSDVRSGRIWSAGYQPTAAEPDAYEAVFAEDRAKFVRRDGSLTTTLDVLVSPEDDAEVRRVTVTNQGLRDREIELTSYAEVVLALPAADEAHPAFSNLFVVTEYVAESGVLLATRRPRSPTEPVVWLAHVLAIEGETIGEAQWETDRARFLGRGQGPRSPDAVVFGRPLSGTVGAVLDPIVSLRRRVRVPAGLVVRATFVILAAATREAAIALAEKYRDAAAFDRVATLAWTKAQVQLHHLGIGYDEAHLYQRLARRALFTDRSLRPAVDALSKDFGGPESLWAHGISGDLPIVLVQIDDPDDVGIVRQLLRAHEYWGLKQLAVDLVILNERAASYVQDLQAHLEALVRRTPAAAIRDGRTPLGRIFILRSDVISSAQRQALLAAARAVLSNRRGTLAEQIAREPRLEAAAPAAVRRPLAVKRRSDSQLLRPELEAFNGLGGFARDGREYVTILDAGGRTPAPWINVVSNPVFGFQVSESGSGYTWSINSKLHQITPWSNDPVVDPPGEVLYIRDHDSGTLWTPTALPIRQAGRPYVARHGQGYTRFEHESHGIAVELLQFVPLEDAIKVSRLKLRNGTGRRRRLSVTAYV